MGSNQILRRGNCFLLDRFTDWTWRIDPPKKGEVMGEWPRSNPTDTDYPAVFPNKGRWCCGDSCATSMARQDFETCAIGVLSTGVEVNIGCVHWGHTCRFRYFYYLRPMRIGVDLTCGCSSTVIRYPNRNLRGVTPQPQRPSTWDPIESPPEWPGGISKPPPE